MKRALALVALALVTVTAPACGDDEGDDSPSTSGSPAAGVTGLCPGDANLWDCTFHPTSTTAP